MQLFITGGMKDFSRYLRINQTFPLICCMSWIFSPAGYATISQVDGSKVILPCNESLTFQQLTWKMNGVNLFSFKQPKHLHIYDKASHLNINMSEGEQYALFINQVQKSHAGNYTCEVTTYDGPIEHTWQLIVTDKAENWKELIVVVATVSCVCCLVFIFSLAILKTVCKQCAANSIQSPAAETVQTEDIYENSLGTSQIHVNNQHFYYKHRAQ
ncbi:hypothetical protein PAMA_003163 [Pampus argenteus]